MATIEDYPIDLMLAEEYDPVANRHVGLVNSARQLNDPRTT